MTVSFFLFMAAALIFRVLAVQAGNTYHARVRALLPRNVMQSHVSVLFREFPRLVPAFRAKALPVHAGQIAFNTLSCATLLAALWIFPPQFLAGFDLTLLRLSGAVVVSGAFIMDAIGFCRITRAARAAGSKCECVGPGPCRCECSETES